MSLSLALPEFSKLFTTLPRRLRFPLVGIDISDRSFKYVKLRNGRSGATVEFFGEGDIPEGAIVSGEVKDSGAFSKALREGLKAHAIHDPVAIALPEEKSFVRFVELPKLTAEEVRDAIALQLEEYVPLNPEEAVFDFDILESVKSEGHLDLVLTAFPRKSLEPYLVGLEGAGLAVAVAEPESQSIARAVIPKHETGTVLVVDIGSTRTSFLIAYRGVTRYTSTIALSGGALTRAVADALNTSVPDAEHIKRQFSFFQEKTDPKIESALMPFLETLGKETIERIAYWKGHSEHDETHGGAIPVTKVYLCGGDAHMAGLPEFLSSVTKLPVLRAEPWRNIFDIERYIPPISAHDALLYATALGLAMRADE